MSFCLPVEQTKKFIQALKEGVIDPGKLSEMDSAGRHEFFSKLVGEADAKEVNALFESKLLLKNQQQGMITWAKRTSGISEPIRRDIISRIENLDRVLNPTEQKTFLNDLASTRLGADVSFDEAKKISEGVKTVQELKSKIPETSPIGSKERIDYGLKFTAFQDYLKELKGKSNKVPLKELLSSPSKVFETVSGTTKSILSSLDNSFFGRQGIKTLYTHPTVWADAFLKSWGDIGKELKGTDAMTPIKADIYSRPNAVNGNYERMGLDIGITSEESFPSSLPERIPLLGRLFKASESAFNGAAMRLRADLADMMVKSAEKQGVDFTQKEEAQRVGEMINSLTGRGSVPLTAGQAKVINNAVFSVKFLKSNFDTLTRGIKAPLEMAKDKITGTQRTPAELFVRKESAMNLAKIVGTTAAILYTAEQLQPGSTKKNPGFITIGNTRFDITGGLASIAMLGYKVSQKVMDKNAPRYGQSTAMDLVNNFWEGKLSPVAGVFRDVAKGKDFNGNKPTASSLISGIVTPLPIQTYQDLQNPGAAPTLASMIADGLGISTYTPPKKK